MARMDIKDGKTLRSFCYSLDEFADMAEKRRNLEVRSDDYDDAMPEWRGATFTEALSMARLGWPGQLDTALEIAESAIEMAEKEHLTEQFTPVWDVTGSEVDVARYLGGVPENMIDFPPMATSSAGRVITVCASVSISHAVRPDTIIRRGQVITALVMALGRLGHSVELWIDHSIDDGRKQARVIRNRILVKGPNDTLDPARIMYAFAHPSVLRQLAFALNESNPQPWIRRSGYPLPPEHDLPEGTIYLPEITSAHDVPDADVALKGYLNDLGLLAG